MSRKIFYKHPESYPFVQANRSSGATFYFEKFSFKKYPTRIEFRWDQQPNFVDLPKIKIGQLVKGNYLGAGEYFPGVISNIRKDGTFDIDYDDFTKGKETNMFAEMIRPLGVDITIHVKKAFREKVIVYKNVQELIKDWEIKKHKKLNPTFHFKLCAKLADDSVVKLYQIKQATYIPMATHTFLNELMAHVPVNDLYRKDYPDFSDFSSHTPERDVIDEDGMWNALVGAVEEFVEEHEPEPEFLNEDDRMWQKIEDRTYQGMRGELNDV